MTVAASAYAKLMEPESNNPWMTREEMDLLIAEAGEGLSHFDLAAFVHYWNIAFQTFCAKKGKTAGGLSRFRFVEMMDAWFTAWHKRGIIMGVTLEGPQPKPAPQPEAPVYTENPESEGGEWVRITSVNYLTDDDYDALFPVEADTAGPPIYPPAFDCKAEALADEWFIGHSLSAL